MIYKLISCKSVISKVLSDLDWGEEQFPYSSVIEWIGEAMEKIGSVRQLKRRVSGEDGLDVLTISGHQVQMPTDLFRINQVAYSVTSNGPWLPMRVATGSFNAWSDTDSDSNSGIYVQDSVLINMIETMWGVDYQTALEMLNTNRNIRTTLTNLIRFHDTDSNYAGSIYEKVLQYSIKPGFIAVSPKVGYIKISYDAIPVDSDGYPLVPDLASYQEALYWYVLMKLKFPEYMSGKMQRQIYYDIKNSWNFYCKQAYADSLMPNQDEMETIKDVWTRMFPDMSADRSFYETLSHKQELRNQGRPNFRRRW